MIKVKSKEKIRKEIREIFKKMDKNEIKRRSKYVRENLQKFVFYKRAKRILFYASKEDEVDTWSLMRGALRENKKVYLPKIKDKNLEIYEIKDLKKDLETGSYSILEPKETCTKLEDIEKLDLILVPLRAADFNKNRIGRGKGFYDRFLKKINSKNIKKIGLCFSFQVFECLPSKKQDVRLDFLITDKGII